MKRASGAPALPPSPQAALAPAAARLVAELRRVRADASDAEAVHDARVAARRLAAAATLWLEPGKPLDKLKGRLDKCVRRLGRVRNADVALDFLAKGPAADGPARKALSKVLRRELKARRNRLAGWLTGERVWRLISALSRAVAKARVGVGVPSPRSLGRQLRPVLLLAGGPHPMGDPRKAHELRREIRILRYQQESIAAAYDEADAAAFRDLFVRLQDAAGGWHDRFQVDRLAAALERKPRFRRAAASLRRRLAREMKQLAEKFVEALADLVRREPALLGQGGSPS